MTFQPTVDNAFCVPSSPFENSILIKSLLHQRIHASTSYTKSGHKQFFLFNWIQYQIFSIPLPILKKITSAKSWYIPFFLASEKRKEMKKLFPKHGVVQSSKLHTFFLRKYTTFSLEKKYNVFGNKVTFSLRKNYTVQRFHCQKRQFILGI